MQYHHSLKLTWGDEIKIIGKKRGIEIKDKKDINYTYVYIIETNEIQKSTARLNEIKREGHGPSQERNGVNQVQREKKSVLSNQSQSSVCRAVKETFKIAFLLVAPFPWKVTSGFKKQIFSFKTKEAILFIVQIRNLLGMKVTLLTDQDNWQNPDLMIIMLIMYIIVLIQ